MTSWVALTMMQVLNKLYMKEHIESSLTGLQIAKNRGIDARQFIPGNNLSTAQVTVLPVV